MKTNRKVAILHDNGPDGQVVGGKVWPALAAKFGYKVVLNESFATDATNFGSVATKARMMFREAVFRRIGFMRSPCVPFCTRGYAVRELRAVRCFE